MIRSALVPPAPNRRRLVALALTALVGGPATPAAAQEHTTAEVVELVNAGDSRSLEDLRATTSIDGRPANLAASLQAPERLDLDSRLRTLAEVLTEPAPPGTDPQLVRDSARRVLDQPKYEQVEVGAVGLFWQRLQRWFVEWVDRLLRSVPGGPRVFFTLLALVVLGGAALVAWRLGRRRNRQLEAFELARRLADRAVDPAELEGAARQAEAVGQYREAVRLRFVAGLLRLDQHGKIEYRPGLTGEEVAMILADPTYDRLAADFDEIVYGDRPAAAEDAAAASRRWQQLLRSER